MTKVTAKTFPSIVPSVGGTNVAPVRGRNWGAPGRQCGACVIIVDCCGTGTPRFFGSTPPCSRRSRDLREAMRHILKKITPLRRLHYRLRLKAAGSQSDEVQIIARLARNCPKTFVE